MSLLGRRVSRLQHVFRNQSISLQTIPNQHIPIATLSTRYHHYENLDTDPRTRDYFNDWRHKQSLSLPSPCTVFDPTDTAKVFQSMSTYQLTKYNFLFTMLSIEPLTNIMTKIMMNAIQPQEQVPDPMSVDNVPWITGIIAILRLIGNTLTKPLVYIVRKQYFPLLTGGENIDQCMKIAKKYYDNNIRLVIDNSTEESESNDAWQRNISSKKELVDVCDKFPKSVCFMSFKITALTSPVLLEAMTTILNTESPLDRDPTPFMNESQLKELEGTIERLSDMCGYAKSKGIGVWLDAEQYPRQPAMNYLSRVLMKKFNAEGDDKIYLYNTYQCYLKESHDWIRYDIEHAKENGYQCGIKLVRGAYLTQEGELAAIEGRNNPIHRSKEDTDRSFDDAVQYVMNEIVESYGNVGIAVCTHNRGSLQNTVDVMDRLGIERDDPHVFSAQLNGMVDNLTYAMGYSGYNALKLIPYGAFEDVWPFLLRRFEENSQILNGVQQERGLYGIEIKRRLKALIGR